MIFFCLQMLARFATGASFSTDCKGGGKESNSNFLPFMIQMARHLLDQSSCSQRRAMTREISSYLTSSSDARPSSSSPMQPSNSTEETVQYMMVSSLLTESYESWLQHRRAFLQRGIYHAYVRHSHNRSLPRGSSPARPESSKTSGTDDLLPIVQPMLVYTGLIEQLQQFFKPRKSAAGASSSGEGTSKQSEGDDENSLESWEIIMKEKLVNMKEMVGFSKELLSWLDDMSSASNLQEAFDIIGALSDVLSGGFKSCEEFLQAAINAGMS